MPVQVPPSRWTLETIRSQIDWLQGYSLSGISRLLHRLGLGVRSARVQQYSPDPDYTNKLIYLELCLHEAARERDKVAFVFLDEMGYTCWPDPGADWSGPGGPLADRGGAKQKQWRLIGALNALSGQVNYLDGYIVGRQKVQAMYAQLVEAYPRAQRLYVAQDNWSIHTHPDVLTALAAWPHSEPVWLPTYSPWLNPIEKLWRWLRQRVLRLHRLAKDFSALRQRVNRFLDQFAHGSEDLLSYVGLLGDGSLAPIILGT